MGGNGTSTAEKTGTQLMAHAHMVAGLGGFCLDCFLPWRVLPHAPG